MRVTVVWTLVCVTWAVVGSLKLAAFNVQIFGQTKAEDPVLMGYLAKVRRQSLRGHFGLKTCCKTASSEQHDRAISLLC